ncbi:MAG: RNA-binding domain-containing protein [Bacteroidota bacterium]
MPGEIRASKDSELVSFLKKNPVFQQLEEEELKELCCISRLKTYSQNELVFSEDQPAHYLFVVAEGNFQLNSHNQDYKVMMPGELFGEIGIINNSVRSGSVRAIETASVVQLDGESLYDPSQISTELALKLTRLLAKRITDYLRTREQVSSAELIEEGEKDFVEFKSTMRFNLKSGQKDKAMEMSVLKSMAAFLNSRGGTLFVGVEDDGNPIGIEKDGFPNEDKYMLHLTNMIKNRMGSEHSDFINYDVIRYKAYNILRVDCEPATQPVYIKDGDKDYFFVRVGPSTINMRLSKVHDYVMQRFEKG